jgi:hypothetical protein
VPKQKTVPVPSVRQGTAERLLDDARDELAPNLQSQTVADEPMLDVCPSQDSPTLLFPCQLHDHPYAIVKLLSQGRVTENIPASI